MVQATAGNGGIIAMDSCLRLLIVEDDKNELEVCSNSVKRYNRGNQDKGCELEIKVEACESVEESKRVLDNSFDGAIIDLRLGQDEAGGNKVIEEITKSNFRIPVFILTGTPDAVDTPSGSCIKVFKKGSEDGAYENLLEGFQKIYATGLTRIMGGRGIIEGCLYKIFQECLLPQMEKWKKYGEQEGDRTEKALLRHTLDHLLQLLDDDEEKSFPEEMYLFPPLAKTIRSGSVVKEKATSNYFVVMNPACDLVVRGEGKRNTDYVILAGVDDQNQKIKELLKKGPSTEEKEKKLRTLFKDTQKICHHQLPKTDFFVGGLLNFRRLQAIKLVDFDGNFEAPTLQIAPSFMKDVIARFSAYYARQGQPDIDYELLARTIVSEC